MSIIFSLLSLLSLKRLSENSRNELLDKIREEKEYRFQMIREGRTDDLLNKITQNSISRISNQPNDSCYKEFNN
jgi:ribonuclease HII